MQRHDRLPGTCRASNPGRTAEVLLHQLALRGVQEHSPSFPWVLKGKRKFLDILHHPEAAQSVGMLERIGARRHRLGQRGLDPGCQVQQGLGRLGRQVPRDL